MFALRLSRRKAWLVKPRAALMFSRPRHPTGGNNPYKVRKSFLLPQNSSKSREASIWGGMLQPHPPQGDFALECNSALGCGSHSPSRTQNSSPASSFVHFESRKIKIPYQQACPGFATKILASGEEGGRQNVPQARAGHGGEDPPPPFPWHLMRWKGRLDS